MYLSTRTSRLNFGSDSNPESRFPNSGTDTDQIGVCGVLRFPIALVFSLFWAAQMN